MTAGYRLLAGAALCALALLVLSRRPRHATALYAAGLTLLASTAA